MTGFPPDAIARAALLLAILPAALPGASRVVLFDEIVKIPRSQWRGLTVNLQQRPATVEVEHLVVSGGSGVRVVLMSRHDVERFRQGRSHRVLAATRYLREATLRHLITRPGEYMVLLDNRIEGRGGAMVQLKVTLAYSPQHASFEPGTLSPGRRRTVVVVSLVGFAVIGCWSGWKLWNARRRSSL
jgi:hypothetical protein